VLAYHKAALHGTPDRDPAAPGMLFPPGRIRYRYQLAPLRGGPAVRQYPWQKGVSLFSGGLV
ncbi:MAG: hypothetical protein, partial [Olavius algarvensis Delta 4 endosymbiont]